jgi:hypothetical protein
VSLELCDKNPDSVRFRKPESSIGILRKSESEWNPIMKYETFIFLEREIGR